MTFPRPLSWGRRARPVAPPVQRGEGEGAARVAEPREVPQALPGGRL